MKILTMILAGGTGEGLSVLTRHRAKTALPFGGRYRIIDFCLSNCIHSGLSDIAVLAQYNPKSLVDHIRMGKPWDLDRKSGGVQILQPTYHGEVANWYLGTADALCQNMDLIRNSEAEHILVLSGDQVYTMDYTKLISDHLARNRPVTLACKSVKRSQRSRFGMVHRDDNGIIRAFEEKPESSDYNYASLGIYIFSKKFILDYIRKGTLDIVFDIVLPALKQRKVGGYLFEGYWEDIGSIQSYFKASMRLLRSRSIISEPGWPIFTRGENLSPAKFSRGSFVNNSIVAGGCTIRGKVNGCILFPGVTVEKGAVVKNSIVFSFSRIGQSARISRSIIDKSVSIGEGSSIGMKMPGRASMLDPRLTAGIYRGSGGITVLGKEVRVGKGISIPRGLLVEPGSIVRD